MKRSRSFMNKLKKEWPICRILWNLSNYFFQAAKFIIDSGFLSSVLQVKLNACFEKPYGFSFDWKRPWFLVSKAFERSINIADIFCSLPKAFFYFCSMTIKECCVPYDFPKPVKHFEILFSIKLLICWEIFPLMTFGMCGNKVTGLQLSFDKGSSFLYTGLALDCLTRQEK